MKKQLVKMLSATIALSSAITFSAAPTFASTTQYQFQTATIEVNNQAILSKVAKFVANNTTYISVYDVQQLVNHMLGTTNQNGDQWGESSWNVIAKNVTPKHLYINSGTAFKINGVTVIHAPVIVSTPPTGRQPTSYVPVWYVQQFLNELLNLNTSSDTWNGLTSTWTINTTPVPKILVGTDGNGVYEWDGHWQQLGSDTLDGGPAHYIFGDPSIASDISGNPSSVVWSAAFSQNGIPIVGTGEGVYEWKNNKWVHLGGGNLDGTPFALNTTTDTWNDSSSVVDSILALPNGNLITGTGAGVYEWDGKTWHLIGTQNLDGTPVIPGAASDESSLVHALVTLPDGSIVAGTSSGVFKLNGNQWEPLGSNSDTVNSLAIMPNTNIVEGGFSGVSEWNGITWHQIWNTRVQSITALPNGDIVAGTRDGAFEWNGSTWSRLGTQYLNGQPENQMNETQTVYGIAVLPDGEIISETGSNEELNASNYSVKANYPIFIWGGQKWSVITGGGNTKLGSGAGVEPNSIAVFQTK